MKRLSKSYTSYFLVAVSYILTVLFVFLFLDYINFTPAELSQETIIQWDADWYRSIAFGGYEHFDRQCNTAFFPMFPVIWKVLHLSPFGISIFNAMLYAAVIAWLAYSLNLIWKIYFFALALPSMVFFYLPFSESTFFLFSTLLLIGFSKQDLKFILVGALGMALTRSAILTFVPVIIFVLIMSQNKESRVRILSAFAAMLLGVFCAVSYTHLTLPTTSRV